MQRTTVVRVGLILIGTVFATAAMLGQNPQSVVLHDPVAELNRKIQEGAVDLRYDETTGYLRAVLEALRLAGKLPLFENADDDTVDGERCQSLGPDLEMHSISPRYR